MSYILDALRRAESERERGQVPGLHAQSVPVALGDGSSERKSRGLQLAAVAAGVLVVLGGTGWWLTRPASEDSGPVAGHAVEAGSAAAPASAVAAATAGPPSTRGDAAAPAGPPMLVAPPAPPEPPAPPPARPRAPAPAPAPALPPAPAPAPAPAVAAVPSAQAVSPTAAAPALAAPAPAPAPAALAASPSPSGAPAAAGAGSAKPTLLSDLPPAQRAEMPQMRVGGSIYSDQPSSRFVVINGLVVREGETAAPGVVLERIAPKAAVIRWRDMRIEMPL